MRSGLLAGIKWSVCMLTSHRSLCESFSRTGAGLCIYHMLVWSNWNFLYISQWITLPTQSCLALYSFCANLLHSLIMWLIVSSLSPHSIHLLFCCILLLLLLLHKRVWRRIETIQAYSIVEFGQKSSRDLRRLSNPSKRPFVTSRRRHWPPSQCTQNWIYVL